MAQTYTPPAQDMPWPVPRAAIDLAAEAEGLYLVAYRCPAGVWTIGRGRTAGVQPGMVCTVEQADRWFLEECVERVEQIKAKCTQPPTPNQLGALWSLHYNIGAGAFESSTVLRAHNRGDWQAAARAFALWNKARVNGVLTELPGLTRRRAAEAALYLTPEPGAPPEPMVQAVQTETPLRDSTTIRSGAVIAGTGVVTAIAEAAGSLQGLGESLRAAKAVLIETLGVPADWILPAVCIGVAWVLIRDRMARRRDGWT